MDIIESKHLHDFKSCKCGKVAVDGGLEYAKRSFRSGDINDHIQELIEFEEDQYLFFEALEGEILSGLFSYFKRK